MKQTIIILLVILIGIGIYLAVNQNNTGSTSSTIQEPISAPVTTPVVSTNQQQSPQATANSTDAVQACAQQATIVYNDMAFHDNTTGILSDEKLSYQAHYNSAQGKCFFVGKDVGINAYLNETELAETFFDAYTYENNHMGNIASYSNTMTNTYPQTLVREDCMINGVTGCTSQQFRAFLNTEMETTTY